MTVPQKDLSVISEGCVSKETPCVERNKGYLNGKSGRSAVLDGARYWRWALLACELLGQRGLPDAAVTGRGWLLDGVGQSWWQVGRRVSRVRSDLSLIHI